MKTLIFMAIVAMFMMFSCTTDDLTTTDQESISVVKNNQAVVSGELTSKGPIKDNNGVGTGLWLKGYSDLNSAPLTIKYADGYPDMKILSEGNFSGKIIGYGQIDADQSTYVITEEYPANTNEGFGNGDNSSGQYIYNLKIDGTIYLTDRASSFFDFTLSGKFYPYISSDQVYVGDTYGLTGEIKNGKFKFIGIEKPINGFVSCGDLTTGIISLRIY